MMKLRKTKDLLVELEKSTISNDFGFIAEVHNSAKVWVA
jgi:hypothetical protein